MLLATYPLLLLLLVAALLSFSHAETTNASAYDVLQSHGLPRGILPRGIQSFGFDASTGRFQATIDPPCTATFDSDVHYNSTISGTMSYGEIASLSGVSTQELFLWFPVLRITVDVPSSGLIYFDVGVVYKRFPLSLFELPPLCTPDSCRSFLSFESGDARHASTLPVCTERENKRKRAKGR